MRTIGIAPIVNQLKESIEQLGISLGPLEPGSQEATLAIAERDSFQRILEALEELGDVVNQNVASPSGLPYGFIIHRLERPEDLPNALRLVAGSNITITKDLAARKIRIAAINSGGDTGCSDQEGAILGAYIGAASGNGYIGPSTVSQIGSHNAVPFPIGGCLRSLSAYIDGTWVQGSKFRLLLTVGVTEADSVQSALRNSNRLMIAGVLPSDGFLNTAIRPIRIEKWETVNFFYQFDIAAGVTTPRVNGISAEFVPDGDYSILIAAQGTGTGMQTVALSTVAYAVPCSGNGTLTTETQRVIVLPFPGTLVSFSFTTNTVQPASGALIGTVRKSGADSALTQTLAASGGAATTNIYSDEANSVSCVAGDYISFKFDNQATASSAVILSASVLYEPDQGTNQGSRIIAGVVNAALAAGITNYSTPMVREFSATDANQRWPIPRDGILRNFYAFVETAGTALTLTVMVDGVDTALTGTVSSSGVVSVDLSNAVTVTQGQYMNVKLSQTLAGGAKLTSWSLELAPAA